MSPALRSSAQLTAWLRQGVTNRLARLAQAGGNRSRGTSEALGAIGRSPVPHPPGRVTPAHTTPLAGIPPATVASTTDAMLIDTLAGDLGDGRQSLTIDESTIEQVQANRLRGNRAAAHGWSFTGHVEDPNAPASAVTFNFLEHQSGLYAEAILPASMEPATAVRLTEHCNQIRKQWNIDNFTVRAQGRCATSLLADRRATIAGSDRATIARSDLYYQDNWQAIFNAANGLADNDARIAAQQRSVDWQGQPFDLWARPDTHGPVANTFDKTDGLWLTVN